MDPADRPQLPGGAPVRAAAPPRRVSALPSVRARVLAFGAILVAGGCGALIGHSFVGIQCTGRCSTAKGLGAVTGGIIAAAGVAVVAVLVLRAMAEWRTILEARAMEEAPAASPAGPTGAGPGDDAPADPRSGPE